MKEISLKARLILGLGSMVLPIAIIGAASIMMFQGAIATFEQTEEERREVLFPLVDLDATITEAADFSGALDFSNPLYRNNQLEWETLKTQILRDLKALENLPATTPMPRGLMQSVEDDLRRGIDCIDKLYSPAFTFDERGLIQKQKDANLSLMNALEGVRNTHYSLTAWSVKENVQRAENFKERFRWMIGCIILLILFLAILASLILTRSILTPIAQMKEGLKRFSEGDLSYRIHVETHDEMQELADSMNLMATSLEKSQLKLQELATHDELTGLSNRREFNRLINIEVERSMRDDAQVSLIMLDLDHFKQLNDNYGHQVGDIALQTIAKLLIREIRPGDYSARFGGEEFAIILPNANIDDANSVAERIRLATEKEAIALPNGDAVYITASLGCASFPSHAQSEFSLLTQADKALYQAKANGRNQVYLAQPLVSMPRFKRKKPTSSIFKDVQN